MKKKILAVIVALMLICLPLTACSESYRNPAVEGEQDPTYAVTSNGGSAVQYGNYVYYMNGYRGYEDEDGSENYWGNVVKGGLYRAELNKGKDVYFDYMTAFGTKVSLKTFESSYDPETSYNFYTQKEEIVTGYEKNDDGSIVYDDNNKPVEITEEIDSPVSYRIASKTIGTSGYAKGGIFIYDEYVYYATPSNHQNREGSFETAKTMFYRTKLDGTETIRLYTSKNNTNNSAYAFYKQNDKVYLVVNDGTSIISVTVGKKKVESVNELATDVTDVLFPVKDIYYSGMDTNQAEDFIYYTREINEDDKDVRAGNIVIAMRPDGSESMQIFSSGITVTLKTVDGGYLFYEEARTGGNVIMFTNLHQQFMDNSPTYKEAYEKNYNDIVKANGENSPLIGHQSGTALNIEDINSYTEIICFRPSKLSNQVYSLCISSSGMQVYDGVELTTIFSDSLGKVYTINDTYVYFTNSSGDFCRTNVYTEEENNEVVTLGIDMNTDSVFALDIIGDLVMMFGSVDDYANDYALFVNLNRIEEGTQFVGVKADEDKYDPSVELEDAE